MTKKQDTMAWLEQKQDIEKKIAELEVSLAHKPDGKQATRKAYEAKTRLEYFINRYGHYQGLNDVRFHANKEAEYRQLAADADRIAKEATLATKSYNAILDEISALRLQLADLHFPVSIDDFSLDGAEKFFKIAVSSASLLIKDAVKKLDQLRARSSELEAELDLCKVNAPDLTEDELVNVDTDAHAERMRGMESAELKANAILDLLNKTDAAISTKEKHLNELRKHFADTLTKAVDAYTAIGIKKTAIALGEMIDADDRYHLMVTQVCSKLAEENGAKPADVFHDTSSTRAAKTRIFPNHMVRQRISAFVESNL